MSFLWLSLSIVFEVMATLSLRASNGFKKKIWLIPVAVGYLLAFTSLALTLSAGMPVAVAYGIWTAVGIGLVAVLAKAIWRDPLTKKMIIGLALIALGVLLVEFG